MKRFLFIIMAILVLNGIVIAAKSEQNSQGIERQDANEVAIAAKSEPNNPSVKKEGAKEIAAAAKSEPNKPSVEKQAVKGVVVATTSEPNGPGIKKGDTKEIVAAAKSEPNGLSAKKPGVKKIVTAAKPEPNRPGIEEQDVKQLIASLASSRKYSRVIEEGTKQLLRTDLKSDEKAFIRLKMAEVYEALSRGRLAKEKYGEILEMHPDYNRNVRIAVRLAELNDSVIMDGTTRNLQQAIDCYRYAIERSADQNRPEHGITLEAHIGLGHLCLHQHEYEEARKHFEAVYLCEPEMMSIVPDESQNMRHSKHPEEDIAEKKAWVLKNLEFAKTLMPRDIVITCIHSDPEESLVALRTLMKAYASDPNVSAIAQSFYEQETTRKESLMKQAGTH